MESVSFDTLTFDHPAAAKPARVSGTLHLPMQAAPPYSCMVILTSSAGVQRHREHYYAQALNQAGVAALIVDSFTGRGVRRTVADQTLVSGAQMEGDAFAALVEVFELEEAGGGERLAAEGGGRGVGAAGEQGAVEVGDVSGAAAGVHDEAEHLGAARQGDAGDADVDVLRRVAGGGHSGRARCVIGPRRG